jgi:hypothetical protein
VAEDLVAGRLERVLPEWDGGEAPVIALYPSAQYVPLKTRVLLDQLAAALSRYRSADAKRDCCAELQAAATTSRQVVIAPARSTRCV